MASPIIGNSAYLIAQVGPQTNADGGSATVRMNKDGGLGVGNTQADYQELAKRGQIFFGANQGPGGTTTTVGLAATYTGLCVSNPAGNTFNLVMLNLGLSVVGAPAALSTIGLLTGFAAAGVVTHTTPLTGQSTLVGGPGSTAKVDSAATLPGTPLLTLPLATIPITGGTAQVVNPPTTGVQADLRGQIVIPPGGYIAVYTSTVLTVIAGFTWAEVLATL